MWKTTFILADTAPYIAAFNLFQEVCLLFEFGRNTLQAAVNSSKILEPKQRKEEAAIHRPVSACSRGRLTFSHDVIILKQFLTVK